MAPLLVPTSFDNGSSSGPIAIETYSTAQFVISSCTDSVSARTTPVRKCAGLVLLYPKVCVGATVFLDGGFVMTNEEFTRTISAV